MASARYDKCHSGTDKQMCKHKRQLCFVSKTYRYDGLASMNKPTNQQPLAPLAVVISCGIYTL